MVSQEELKQLYKEINNPLSWQWWHTKRGFLGRKREREYVEVNHVQYVLRELRRTDSAAYERLIKHLRELQEKFSKASTVARIVPENIGKVLMQPAKQVSTTIDRQDRFQTLMKKAGSHPKDRQCNALIDLMLDEWESTSKFFDRRIVLHTLLNAPISLQSHISTKDDLEQALNAITQIWDVLPDWGWLQDNLSVNYFVGMETPGELSAFAASIQQYDKKWFEDNIRWALSWAAYVSSYKEFLIILDGLYQLSQRYEKAELDRIFSYELPFVQPIRGAADLEAAIQTVQSITAALDDDSSEMFFKYGMNTLRPLFKTVDDLANFIPQLAAAIDPIVKLQWKKSILKNMFEALPRFSGLIMTSQDAITVLKMFTTMEFLLHQSASTWYDATPVFVTLEKFL